MIEADELPLDAIRDARIFWATVTGLSQEPSRAAHFAAWAGPRPTHRTPSSTSTTGRCSGRTRSEASAQVDKALDHVTVAVGNREECEVAVGETDPQRAADALLERGVELAVVKQGPQGRAGRDRVTSASRCRPSPSTWSTAWVPATPSAGPCATGCSRAGTCAGSSSSPTSPGAIVASQLECSTAMPTTAEVESLLAGSRS